MFFMANYKRSRMNQLGKLKMTEQKVTFSDTQIASIAAIAALLPLGSVLAPGYGVIKFFESRDVKEKDAVLGNYSFKTLSKTALVTLLWVTAASHQNALLLGIVTGISVTNMVNSGQLPVAEFNSVRSDLNDLEAAVRRIDLTSYQGKAQSKLNSLKITALALLDKAKALTKAKPSNEELVATEVVEAEAPVAEVLTTSEEVATDKADEVLQVQPITDEIAVETNPSEIVEVQADNSEISVSEVSDTNIQTKGFIKTKSKVAAK